MTRICLALLFLLFLWAVGTGLGCARDVQEAKCSCKIQGYTTEDNNLRRDWVCENSQEAKFYKQRPVLDKILGFLGALLPL